MLTERELTELQREDLENMAEDPLVDEIAYYVYGQGKEVKHETSDQTDSL